MILRAKIFLSATRNRFYLALLFAVFSLAFIAYRSRHSAMHSLEISPVLGKTDWTILRPGRLFYANGDSPAGTVHLARFTVRPSERPPWNLSVDDCLQFIEVNGRRLDLGPILEGRQGCELYAVYKIPDSPAFDGRENEVTVGFRNTGGATSFALSRTGFNWRHLVLYGAMSASLWFLLSCWPMVWGFGSSILGLFFGSSFLSFLYFDKNIFFMRGNDPAFHVEHVERVLDGHFFNFRGECWECFQPEGYYWLSALVEWITIWLPVPVADKTQLISIVLFSICLILGYALIRLLVSNRFHRFLAVSLLALWPNAAFHASRVGNDILEYALTLASLLCYLQWIQKRQTIKYGAALAFALAAVFVKDTGIVLLAFLPAATFLELRRRPAKGFFKWQRYGKFVFVYFAGFLAARYSFALKNSGPARMGDLRAELQISQRFSDLFVTGWGGFTTRPFPNPWTGDDRTLFLNYLFKTMVWGENLFQNPKAAILGGALNAVAILLFFFALYGLAVGNFKKERVLPPIYLFLGLNFAMVFSFRALFAVVTASDFRYIYPVMPLFLAFSVRGIQSALGENWVIVRALTYGAIFAFLAGSVFFNWTYV